MNIYGLMCVFPLITTIAMLLGVVIEGGKLLAITILHMSWSSDRFLHRPYYLTAAVLLTAITFLDVFGYLYFNYSKSTENLKALEVQELSLIEQKSHVQKQIQEIDNTLSALPKNHVSRRLTLRDQTGYNQLQNRIDEIDLKLGALARRRVGVEMHSGPVFVIARIFGLDENMTVLIYILILSIVTEMLSVGTLVAIINFAQKNSRADQHPPPKQPPISKPVKPDRAESNLLPNIPNKKTTAGKNRRIGETGKTKTVLPKTSNEKVGDVPRQSEMLAICRDYKITAENLAKITGRQNISTVIKWLSGERAIPQRAHRQLLKWVRAQKN
jgi:hypothetical protein